jgi:ferric-dicitrate binding protein FerR (iron transport regulator)
MVAAERLDNCADMAMDWLAKDQAFHMPHGGRSEADYWRNQWQLHKAMLARIEGRKGHLFMPNAKVRFSE